MIRKWLYQSEINLNKCEIHLAQCCILSPFREQIRLTIFRVWRTLKFIFIWERFPTVFFWNILKTGIAAKKSYIFEVNINVVDKIYLYWDSIVMHYQTKINMIPPKNYRIATSVGTQSSLFFYSFLWNKWLNVNTFICKFMKCNTWVLSQIRYVESHILYANICE